MQFTDSKTISRTGRVRFFPTVALLLAIFASAGCTMASDLAAPEVERSAASAQENASPARSTTESLHPAASSDHTVPLNRQAIATPVLGTVLDESVTAVATHSLEASAAESDIQDGQKPAHTVQPGDTLTRIAERYNVSISALLKVNDLPNPDFLEVGQVIHLPQTPVKYTPAFRIVPDSRLVRSAGAIRFDTDAFLRSQTGILPQINVFTPTRLADGTQRSDALTASQIIERVSREYSVDARLLLAFLEHFAGLVTASTDDENALLYPLVAPDAPTPTGRKGLYAQLSWLADRLNEGYYDWKYRSVTILEAADGSRLNFHPDLNAGTIGLQFAIAQLRDAEQWEIDVGETGLFETYRRLFGDPFEDAHETKPAELIQPLLTLPFPRGDIWRFTGGFHGGWGNGSAWSAVDFAPPDEEQASWCFTSSFPITAIAAGIIARIDDGIIVLDLDGDGNEGSGWTILYLHVSPHDALQEGQVVDAGNILGYTSCAGGFSTATHLHIARRFNGEWIPADCNRCPQGVAVPPFVMSHWQVVGLGSQLYQGFLVNTLDNRSVIAEQGRYTDVNAISW
ncbi:MAG: LysM peptidoglycan-binding domain-containing protein [Chloroflexi bacterium]|nr:LysM peptidoglycan-binding domain-containing protein [Chloroflexota bacterium]